MPGSDVEHHGFTAVPVDHAKLLDPEDAKKFPPGPIGEESFDIPLTDLSKAILIEAKENLPKETFHHSLRVYCFGLTLMPFMPEACQSMSHETWLLACLLHDLGTAPQYLTSTHMSFEFYGGILAHRMLLEHKTPQPQADGVAESIIRHQDVGKAGNITALGAVLQVATILDNTGSYAEFLHPDTIKTVATMYPRDGWTGCFAKTVREEGKAKPWAHTTKMGIEEFAGAIEGNKVMQPYD